MPSLRCLSSAAGGLCLLVLFAPLRAVAAPDALVVVTATRIAQPLHSVLSDVSVIDRAAIDAAGTSSLTQLLQRLAGVEISASGGAGQVSGVFLRGSNANHVVLLIDGVRVNSATAGSNAFEHLSLDQIERIEILRGPASGLYGADAIGGVIQIFTRRDHGVQGRVEFGSERTRAMSASFDAETGAARFGLQAGVRATHGGSATNASHPFSFHADDDPYRNANAGLWFEQTLAAGHTFGLRGQLNDGRTHFDAGAGSDDVGRQRLSLIALESRNRWSTAWSSLLRLARGSDDLRTEGGFPSRFATDQDQFSWQHDLVALGGQIAAGVEWRREKVRSDTAFSITSRSVSSAFGSYAGSFGDHGLQLALRQDHNTQFGSHLTGNAAWGWQIVPRWRLSAAAGTAFKAPSFNDLYYPSQFGYAGNPALRPERSQSVELGARYAHEGFSAGLVAFDNSIRDLIVINSSFTTVENLARARNRGLTLSSAYSQGPWSARAEWTHQLPRDEDSGAPLPRRARDFGSLGLDWRDGVWQFGADVVASGQRTDSGGSTLAGYGLIHVHAAWQATRQLRLSARLDNLADKVYTLVQGYNQPGRGIFVALEFSGH